MGLEYKFQLLLLSSQFLFFIYLFYFGISDTLFAEVTFYFV